MHEHTYHERTLMSMGAYMFRGKGTHTHTTPAYVSKENYEHTYIYTQAYEHVGMYAPISTSRDDVVIRQYEDCSKSTCSLCMLRTQERNVVDKQIFRDRDVIEPYLREEKSNP